MTALADVKRRCYYGSSCEREGPTNIAKGGVIFLLSPLPPLMTGVCSCIVILPSVRENTEKEQSHAERKKGIN
jgi:hypothetical protein